MSLLKTQQDTTLQELLTCSLTGVTGKDTGYIHNRDCTGFKEGRRAIELHINLHL